MAVIGAVFDDDNGSGSGSAYSFRFDGSNWVQEQKLLASDGESSDHFGRSVALSGDFIVIGADGTDNDDDGTVSAYVFTGLSDCNDNGRSDQCDIADGTSSDDNANGIPDECD